MQGILLALAAQALEHLFLLNQFRQSMVEISLYQHQNQKDVQTVQGLERLGMRIYNLELFPTCNQFEINLEASVCPVFFSSCLILLCACQFLIDKADAGLERTSRI